jgi:glucose/arabinose dehydrogenase
MYQDVNERPKLCLQSQNDTLTERYLNPSDIYITAGYHIEVFLKDLNSPIGIVFTEDGHLLIADSGLATGIPRVLRLIDNRLELIAENFNIPISGINYLNGVIYVSHRGFVTKIFRDGTRQNIIMGLPSNGDNYNSPIAFSPDNTLYFGQGTVTNSGVVGKDNRWIPISPLLCDYTGDYIMLNGQNFETNNIMAEALTDSMALTGAFSPYGIPNQPYEYRKKYVKASGSIIRSKLDGSDLEQYAWGFRNPAFLKFDNRGQLYAVNNGYNAIGSRPIGNATDDFYYIMPNIWYGWPDYSGGEAVNSPRFTPVGGQQPTLLFKNQPNVPPVPFVTFPPNSNIRGFDFNYDENFGAYGDVYVAEFGSTLYTDSGDVMTYAHAGHRVSKIDMRSRTTATFAINKTGFPSSISREGGFERPSQVLFGSDGAMYIVDTGLNVPNDPVYFIPNTGVIWRVYRSEV